MSVELVLNPPNMANAKDQLVLRADDQTITIENIAGEMLIFRTSDWPAVKTFIDQQLEALNE